MSNLVRLSKGAVEPAEVGAAGNEYRAWKGAIEPRAPLQTGSNLSHKSADLRHNAIALRHEDQTLLHNRQARRHTGASSVQTIDASLISYYSTDHSIGIKWPLTVTQDLDYNAVVSVEYRKTGSGSYKSAQDLYRNDYQWFYLTDAGTRDISFAGSIMFLTPGTSYDVRLTYTDPDLEEQPKTVSFTIATKSDPVRPTGGTTYYVDGDVAPGGDGSSGDPFASILEAQSSLSPGDIVRIRAAASPYAAADRTAGMITTTGTEDNWIVYEEDPASPGAVFSQLSLEHGAEWIWIDGLTFTYAGGQTVPATRQGLVFWDEAAVYVAPPRPSASMDNICVTGCTFSNFRDSIYSQYAASSWIAKDNTITGMWDAGDWAIENPNSSSGYGIALGPEAEDGGSGHIIAYNTITQCTKPIACGGSDPDTLPHNCDVYGNDIFDSTGTIVSFDDGYENMRCYGNRLAQTGFAFVTMQPQRAGPWYYLYNQMVLADGDFFKWSVQDRMVFINNTFHPGYTDEAQQFTRCFMRNNLFLVEAQFVWTTTDRAVTNDPSVNRVSNWFTDEATTPKIAAQGWEWMGSSDYNGFDRDLTSNILFRWNYDAATARTDFNDPVTVFDDFFAEVGMEEHSIDVDADLIFVSKTYAASTNLLLASGANVAVEAGEKVDNLCDWYDSADTKAPDLGCHNRTDGAPHYGVRTAYLGDPLDERPDDWTKH